MPTADAEDVRRARRELVAQLAHDLRSPLNAIIGFTSLLHGGRAGALTDQQREYLADILASARNLQQVIDANLDPDAPPPPTPEEPR